MQSATLQSCARKGQNEQLVVSTLVKSPTMQQQQGDRSMPLPCPTQTIAAMSLCSAQSCSSSHNHSSTHCNLLLEHHLATATAEGGSMVYLEQWQEVQKQVSCRSGAVQRWARNLLLYAD